MKDILKTKNTRVQISEDGLAEQGIYKIGLEAVLGVAHFPFAPTHVSLTLRDVGAHPSEREQWRYAIFHSSDEVDDLITELRCIRNAMRKKERRA